MKSIYEQEELRKIEEEYIAAEEKDKLSKKKYSIWKPWTWPWWVLLLMMAVSILARMIFVRG